ncbi:uncharacterized protein LOC121857821 [Homarus americanus]|uniref:uncharacterized protein LOC121857821 n=1 Tax=Homarus americanus TaxID=6706 RepID=UPI001C454044|nr:uncharacterized protein LOC121857821 [Homarus americanus]
MATAIPTLQPLELEEADQTQAWTDWIEHAEDAFIAFNITEDAKRLALIRLYGGKKLKEIMKTLRPAILTDKKEPTYKTMRIALDEYFSEKTNEVFERHKFRMLAQEVGESTHNYVTRLRTQGAKCNFDNYNLDQAIIDQLTEKCTSHKMRRAYLKETDITVQKALQITYTYESTEAQACQMEQGEEGTNVNKVNTRYKQQQQRDWESNRRQQSKDMPRNPKLNCLGCNGTGHRHGQRQCPAFGKNCNYCGIVNHFATACRKKHNRQERVRQLTEDS